jgi:hypothetical protein
MTAFFTAGWSGMPMIEDLERGVVDRFLVSPVRRSSLITGRLVNAAQAGLFGLHGGHVAKRQAGQGRPARREEVACTNAAGRGQESHSR